MKKKGIGIILALALALVLAACGSKDLEETAFESEQMGIESTITYFHDGDEVKKQTAENVVPYEAIGVAAKEDAQAIFDPEAEKFKGIDGIKHEITYTDTEATEKLEIDYDELDFDKAKGLPGMTIDSKAEEDGVSLEKSTEMLKNQGFTEKE